MNSDVRVRVNVANCLICKAYTGKRTTSDSGSNGASESDSNASSGSGGTGSHSDTTGSDSDTANGKCPSAVKPMFRAPTISVPLFHSKKGTLESWLEDAEESFY